MVIKAETCGFIILRPVCQYIYSFQYFFDKPIAFQLLKIIGTDAYSKFRQLLHQRVGTPDSFNCSISSMLFSQFMITFILVSSIR